MKKSPPLNIEKLLSSVIYPMPFSWLNPKTFPCQLRILARNWAKQFKTITWWQKFIFGLKWKFLCAFHNVSDRSSQLNQNPYSWLSYRTSKGKNAEKGKRGINFPHKCIPKTTQPEVYINLNNEFAQYVSSLQGSSLH